MSEIDSYVIATVDAEGRPVAYLPPMGEGWVPHSTFRPVRDIALAWRFFDRQLAEETADVLRSNPANPKVGVFPAP
ncbi:Uncharacterised protein [Mycobacteroides abscessus subsp. bolletii]|uniref:hypothetical protein n=1 Tax=Mycobacteroides abscessus TaxID=36809 RepID=UPI0009A84775|nr:hypothetical protein [Mycobacteroides abscessus]QOF29125.1 hypothetical protein E3G43_002683 [Mycobacteroides abscessus]SLB58743.1 Uncharacterised protein [Mycobacteroides abscessus subsp. bolletii]